MLITDRQKDILDKIIQEYIDSAEPVPSQSLEKKYDFGLSPATIRGEMHKLTEEGFLYQPHTSAGRVPTDKGYRFFVDNLLNKEFNIFSAENWFAKELDDNLKIIQKLTDNLAYHSGALTFSYDRNDDILWKEGWEEILKEPEFEERDYLINFTEFSENFENNIKELEIDSGIKIYIGKENPFSKTKEFTIISAECTLPDHHGIVLSLLGPKRMAYDKNIGLMNSLIKLLKRF